MPDESVVNSGKEGTVFPVWFQVRTGPKKELEWGVGGRGKPAVITLWWSFQADRMMDRYRGAQPGLACPSSFPLLH